MPQTDLKDPELIRFHQRVRDDWVRHTDTSCALELLAVQQADGAWPDIDYADTAPQRWAPIKHLVRTRGLMAAWLSPGHTLYRCAEALDAVHRALSFWIERKPFSRNWWQLEVNVNQQLGAILVMGKGILIPAILKAGIAALPPVREDRWSAQNRIYTSFRGVCKALMEDDKAELVRQFRRIRGEAVFKTGLGPVATARNDNRREGVRRDHSFHQHGVALYNGFYGAHFVQDMAMWMVLSDGLSFGFTDAEKQFIQDHLLEGQQWMNRHGVPDPNTTNRKISHPSYDYVTPRYRNPVVDALAYLCRLPLPRARELENFYRHMTTGAPSQIRGNRYFWKSAFMVHAGEGYQISTKLWSVHNLGTESLNGDNLQGGFLALGGTFLLMDGTEYLDIFPVWDWGRIPGTTTLHRNPGPPPPELGAPGPTLFAGGVSNGVEGAMAYDHDYDFVRARKSWFYFQDAIVLLGAGICGGDGRLAILTTLNQCLLQGDVVVSSSGQTMIAPRGDWGPAQVDWVYHGRVGYLFPRGGPVVVSCKTQQGRWSDINDALSDEWLHQEVFTIGFDHGVFPRRAEYAAVLIPAVDCDAFDNIRATNPVEILANRPDLQAVRHRRRRLTQIVFYAAGTLETWYGLRVAVSDPCLVMVEETETPPRIYVSDPTQSLATLTLRLTGPGKKERVLLFELPQGDDAGRSTDDYRQAPASLCQAQRWSRGCAST